MVLKVPLKDKVYICRFPRLILAYFSIQIKACPIGRSTRYHLRNCLFAFISTVLFQTCQMCDIIPKGHQTCCFQTYKIILLFEGGFCFTVWCLYWIHRQPQQATQAVNGQGLTRSHSTAASLSVITKDEILL